MAAIGGLIGFMIYFSYHYKINIIPVFLFLFVLSGVIASARIKLNAHTLNEIFWGYSLGITTQLFVYFTYVTICKI
jgi:hypothetical protein